MPAPTRPQWVALMLSTALATGLVAVCALSSGCGTTDSSTRFSWGPSLTHDERAKTMEQHVVEAAREGKGFIRYTVEGGIGEAPASRTQTSTENGWAPTQHATRKP